MVKKVLEAIRIVDSHDGQLSLTNVALIIVLVKLAIAPEVSATEIGALFIALATYSSKKIINKSADAPQADPNESLTKQVNELSDKVSALSLASGIKKMGG